MTRLFRIPALGVALSSLLAGGVASAQPAVGAAPPAPAAPVVAGAATAIAGVTPAYVEKPKFDNGNRLQGWSPKLSAGGTLAFANNSGVVGQADGSSLSIGLKVGGSLDFNHEQHEWRNNLGVVASITKTPVITDFVKTSDNLNYDSTYLFHVVPWFGPFARFSLNTSMFRGTDVRPAPVDYVITRVDGSVARVTSDHLTMSDGFRPLTLKQSIGLFLQPYQSDPVTVELRGGAGGQEVLADDQLAIKAPAKAPADPLEIDVTQLQNVNQLGGELAFSIWGAFAGKKITYKANADAMTPFVHSPLPAGDTRGAFALTNLQFDAALSFHFVDWASIDYQFKAIRQPQVIDAFQIQNTLLLTFGLSYGNKPPVPVCACAPAPAPAPPPPPAAPPPPPPPPPAAPPPPPPGT